MKNRSVNWGAVGVLVAFIVGELALVAYIASILQSFSERNRDQPELTLTLLLLAGMVAFIAVITTAVAVLSALNLADRSQSFGLPEGTIRSIIALSLIIIFAMTSVYLYGQIRNPRVIVLRGLTQSQVDALPGEQIVGMTQAATATLAPPDGSGDTNVTASTEARFDVFREVRSTPASEQFAQQILTTIGTLVVAVSGFYFGAKVAGAGRDALEGASLSILSPEQNTKLLPSDKPLSIRLETHPKGLAIEGVVDGKTDPSLKQGGHGEFIYVRPALPKAKSAVLTFTLVANPAISQQITIDLEDTPQTEIPPAPAGKKAK